MRNGAIVYDNVKLTATAGTNGSLTWQPEAGVTLAGGMAGEKYFLYYPYQETAKMAGKVNATDTTSDGDFFATLINDWRQEADQSDYTQGYTASDLMTATGSGSKADGKLSLSFSMTHRMALAVVEMPKTVYKFTDTSIPDYVIATTADFSGEAKPCRNTDGTYRYFVRPGQGNTVTLTGSYADGKKEFFITPNNISVSSYKTYKVDGAPTIDKDHNLQVGDYLLADGNIVGRDQAAGRRTVRTLSPSCSMPVITKTMPPITPPPVSVSRSATAMPLPCRMPQTVIVSGAFTEPSWVAAPRMEAEKNRTITLHLTSTGAATPGHRKSSPLPAARTS